MLTSAGVMVRAGAPAPRWTCTASLALPALRAVTVNAQESARALCWVAVTSSTFGKSLTATSVYRFSMDSSLTRSALPSTRVMDAGSGAS